MNPEPLAPAASTAASDATPAGRIAELEGALAQRSAELAVLEQQAATAEILRAISASPSDTAPVFAAIVDNTLRLCEATFACLLLIERGLLVAASHTTTSPEFSAYLEAGFAIDRSTTAGRAATSRRSQQIVDIHADPEFRVTAAHVSEGVRTSRSTRPCPRCW